MLPGQAAPEVSLVYTSTAVSVNSEFDLFLKLFWQGDADRYIIVPPRLVLPDGLTQVSASFFSEVKGDARTCTYRFILRAERSGEFTVQPVTIKYWEKDSGKENALLSDEVVFEAKAFILQGPKNIRIIFFAAAGGACFLFAVFMARRRIFRRRSAPSASKSSDRDVILQKLDVCKQYKLKGDYRAFYQQAADVAGQLFQREEAFCTSLFETLEKVQFGGYCPGAEEVDRVLRYLEKKARATMSAQQSDGFEYVKKQHQ